jgi:LPS sulfotransferase NodH
LRARFSRLWQALVDDRELAIIHLRRRNMLETLVSITTAFKTNRWWSHSGMPTLTMVHLDPEQCLACFQKLDALAADADQMFSGHRKLDLFYEDLVRRRDDTLTRVSAFLDVAIHPASTRLNKLVNVPASSSIENYAELKEFFQGSIWTEFFP